MSDNMTPISTTTSEQNEREAFETFMSNKGYSLDYAGDNVYRHQSTQLNWELWQHQQKRIDELQMIASEQKLIIEGLKGECKELGVTDICLALARKDTEIKSLQAQLNVAVEALEIIAIESHEDLWQGQTSSEALNKINKLKAGE